MTVTRTESFPRIDANVTLYENYVSGLDTTNSYASVWTDGALVGCQIGNFTGMKTIRVINTGASNAMYYKIYLSNDRSNWYAAKAETEIAASGEATETLVSSWRWIDIQIKSKTTDQHTTCNAELRGSRP